MAYNTFNKHGWKEQHSLKSLNINKGSVYEMRKNVSEDCEVRREEVVVGGKSPLNACSSFPGFYFNSILSVLNMGQTHTHTCTLAHKTQSHYYKSSGQVYRLRKGS